jgi:hypothetical protein
MAPAKEMDNSRKMRLLVASLLVLIPPNLAAAAPCYDLRKGQPTGLTGILSYGVSAGLPNYDNAQKGGAPEGPFVLRLPGRICIRGEKPADPKTSFRDVQLVQTSKIGSKLRPLLHQQVTVSLKAPGVDREHRHQTLFAWVTGIVPTTHQMAFTEKRGTLGNQMQFANVHGSGAGAHQTEYRKERGSTVATNQVEFAKERGPAAVTRQVKLTEEDRTAATMVKTFYAGLTDGRGDMASAMVVPQKRAHGPFSAGELSRFYGHLKKRIRLVDVEKNGPSEFLVRYRYAASARDCNGRAVVKTVMLSGKNYIKSINALDRC